MPTPQEVVPEKKENLPLQDRLKGFFNKKSGSKVTPEASPEASPEPSPTATPETEKVLVPLPEWH